MKMMLQMWILMYVFLTWLHTLLALDIQLVPSQVVLTSNVPPTTSVTCTYTRDTFLLRISRKRPAESRFVKLASVISNEKPTLSSTISQDAPDIENRKPTLTGGIKYHGQNTLTIELDTSTITCDDAAEFECEAMYNVGGDMVGSEYAYASLTVYSLPRNLSMTVTKGNMTVSGGNSTDPAVFNVGEIATISCTGEIGNDNTTSIRWRITSDLSGTDNFFDYCPPAGTGSESQPGDYADCSYSRTATINYTMTTADANRQNNLIIQCYISVNPPGQGQYEIPDSPMFYIDVLPLDDQVITTTSDDNFCLWVIIVGAVVSNICVLLILRNTFMCLKKKKKKDGSRSSANPRKDFTSKDIEQQAGGQDLEIEQTGGPDLPNQYQQLQGKQGLPNQYQQLHGAEGLQNQYYQLQLDPNDDIYDQAL